MPRRPAGSAAASVWLRPPQRQRQPSPAFSREAIAQAAVELADAEGLQAVSMRRIAARIGSAPTSLYWYLSDKDQIYELMVDAVIGEIELPGRPSGDWRRDLAAIAWATRVTGSRHPWFAQLGIYPVLGPQTVRYGEVALRSLAGLGLDDPTKLNILAAVNNYIFGFLQREEAWRSHPPLAAGQHPAGAEATGVSAEVVATRTGLHTDSSFEFGLNCLLDGIERHTAVARPSVRCGGR